MKTYKMITSAVLAAMLLSGCGAQSGTITTITAPASETEGEASAIVSETAEETSVEAELRQQLRKKPQKWKKPYQSFCKKYRLLGICLWFGRTGMGRRACQR